MSVTDQTNCGQWSAISKHTQFKSTRFYMFQIVFTKCLLKSIQFRIRTIEESYFFSFCYTHIFSDVGTTIIPFSLPHIHVHVIQNIMALWNRKLNVKTELFDLVNISFFSNSNILVLSFIRFFFGFVLPIRVCCALLIQILYICNMYVSIYTFRFLHLSVRFSDGNRYVSTAYIV